MMKRGNTPVNPPKRSMQNQNDGKRAFGNDLKEMIASCHNQLNE